MWAWNYKSPESFIEKVRERDNDDSPKGRQVNKQMAKGNEMALQMENGRRKEE